MPSFVPDTFDDCPPPLGEEPSHPEHPEHLGETNLVINELLQVVINTILATLFRVIILLFRFATRSVPDQFDYTTPPVIEEPSRPEHSWDTGEAHLSRVQEVAITTVRATGVILGLRRIPVGFYVTVLSDGAEWQTSNTPVYVDQAVVEWNERIPLPSKPSSKVRLSVYASFELGPMLGHGELLRTIEISVGELLDRSERSLPIIFEHKQEEVVSSCTLLLVIVEQRRSDEKFAEGLRLVTPSKSCDMYALILRTDAGHRLLARYRRTQNKRDLDQSIKHFERASDLCPMDHFCYPAALFNLAVAKFVSCQTNGSYTDLDNPISLFQDALDLRPTGHPDRPATQLHLAMALLSRFAKGDCQIDADAAEESLNEVLTACHVNSHVHRAALLVTETSTLHSARNTNANHIRTEGSTTPMLPCSPDELLRRANLCLQRDDPHALDEVISLHYDALEYYSAMHALRVQLLGNLGVMLDIRFQRRGNIQDINQAIALHREALALRPVGYPDRSLSLINLANGLCTRFKHRGHDKDLDDAIMFHREAVDLYPVGHPDRSLSLINLAEDLSTRFEHRGDDQDLDGAIALHREALGLIPVGHPLRSMSLNNLAKGLAVRFEHRGNDQDLDEAVSFHREALDLRPLGHPDRSMSFNNLANVLCIRFDHRGNDQDLDEAIALHRKALAVRPVGHPDRCLSLHNLGNGLSIRFKRRVNDQDLDEAIALQREALALRPVGHPDRSGSFDNLASRLSTRFEHRGNDQDLREAIALSREALALRPVGHLCRPSSLHNLAATLCTSFEHQGHVGDLNESLENLHCALALLTQHDPRRLTIHHSLATVYLTFHQSGLRGTGECVDNLNAAMDHLKEAAHVVSGGLLLRLRASLRWVRDANEHTHDTKLEAYATSMQLLDAYISATASVSSRHNAMKDFPRTLAVDAASCALRSGDACRAIELLEQGRTLIWTQMARLRTPLDCLSKRGGHAEALVKKFRDISSLLDKSPAEYREDTPRVDVEAETTRYARLLEDWKKAVEEIRKLEGFSRFLLPPLFSEIQDAARDGPIIVLVASKSSCDAIIILHKQPPISIQLPTDQEKLARLVVALRHAIRKDAGPKRAQPELIKALRKLWNDIVRPVVHNLGGFARHGSRIWWCPTVPPLGPSLYVSSYTPSLTALLRARRSHERSLSVSFAAIGQNRPEGASFTLDCVEPELELVRSLVPPPPTVSFTKIMSIDATKSRALCALRDNTWLHLACHGTQKHDEPFKSAFLMRDQPLSLLDIAQMDLSQHEFAFLSACETAVGTPYTPDEVVHLAAGLQFAGVTSVVGTLWKVNDATVERLVEAFYKNFCGDGTMNSKRAARSLHRAVQSLACDKDMPLDQRIVFMHIGV
ncbi:hypothetical protein P692DRAFT_20867258 [Suillus brevipes Sb2]|nr:hypothetical protein P692DRAFT_20867258 [Suillus brevipes Sb2]